MRHEIKAAHFVRLAFLSRHRGALLSPSWPHSVCDLKNSLWAPTPSLCEHKKTSLQRLASARSGGAPLSSPFIFFPHPAATSSRSLHSIIQTPSSTSPGLVQHRIVCRLPLRPPLSLPSRATLILNTFGVGITGAVVSHCVRNLRCHLPIHNLPAHGSGPHFLRNEITFAGSW